MTILKELINNIRLKQKEDIANNEYQELIVSAATRIQILSSNSWIADLVSGNGFYNVHKLLRKA